MHSNSAEGKFCVRNQKKRDKNLKHCRWGFGGIRFNSLHLMSSNTVEGRRSTFWITGQKARQHGPGYSRWSFSIRSEIGIRIFRIPGKNKRRVITRK